MAKATKKQPEVNRYRLIAGLHSDKDGLHDAKDPKTYIVESARDLAKQFPEKFRRLGEVDDLPKAPESGVTDLDNLDNMTDAQLSQLAKDNEVDLTGARSREDAIELIRNALDNGPVDDDNA